MALVFRWLVRLFVAASVIFGLGVTLVYYLASRSLPDYDGDHRVAGLAAPLEIVRDNANIPHIFGQTDTDSFYGLGYVHAQDRLWQMLMMRRTAQGKLSEIFGERTFEIDRLMRRLDIYNLSTASVAAQDEYGKAALDAYARGVNAWINQVNEDALGRGAPELFLFPMAISPWTPPDSLSIARLMALQLAQHVDHEVLRTRTSLVLPEERIRDLLPDSPGKGVATVTQAATLFPTLQPDMSPPDMSARLALGPVVPLPAQAGASNAWAAMATRAAKRGTLLASDPHLGLTAPSNFYLARLDLYSGPVIGATIPGMPLVLVGRSETLGWGLTSSGLDDQDILIEQVNPDNQDEYRTPDGWKPFKTRQTIISVKGAPPRTVALRWTDNGPVLPDGTWDLDKITPAGHVPALSWTALTANDTTMSAFLKLMQSQSVDRAIAAAEGMIAPSNNITLGDQNGVGIVLAGAMPRRSLRHQSQGRIPSPGWIPENRWQGRLDFADNPKFTNPESGIIGNTNNKIIDRPFPRHVSHDWSDSQRVLRWQYLMKNRQVHTRESFMEAQLDTVSVTARTLLALVGRELFFTESSAPDNSIPGRRKMALDLLAAWNGDMNEHRPEPLIYSAWMRALQDRLLRDELAGLANGFNHLEPLFIERVFRDIDGASIWCDVRQSAAQETCTDIARIALDDALLWIDNHFGGRLEALRWGDAHESRADHAVLGGFPGLSWLVNIRQSTSGGDNTLQRGKTSGDPNNPFLNVHASAFRGVYDFADPDSSVFVISTGQSGHPLSRYYDDMAALWRRGEYVPMTLDPTLARAAAVGITRLSPN